MTKDIVGRRVKPLDWVLVDHRLWRTDTSVGAYEVAAFEPFAGGMKSAPSGKQWPPSSRARTRGASR